MARAIVLGLALLGATLAQGVWLAPGERYHTVLSVPSAGDYQLTVTALIPETVLEPPVAELKVGQARQLLRLPLYYRPSGERFPRDRFGRELAPPWQRAERPATARLTLTLAAEEQLTLTLVQGAMALLDLALTPAASYPSYAEYTAQLACQDTAAQLTLEAEQPSYVNDPALRPAHHPDLSVTPQGDHRPLNILGGEGWSTAGSAAYYQLVIPESGCYAISLRVLQNFRPNFTVFRRITLNGQPPFAELAAFPIPYAPGWQQLTLGAEGEPYRIYLPAGVHLLGIEATDAPYRPAIERAERLLGEINALALELRRLTGGRLDRAREWVLADYLPDIGERLNAMIAQLEADEAELTARSAGAASPEALSYRLALAQLRFFAEDPDRLPHYPGRFAEGPGSAAQLLASLAEALRQQPLALDRLALHPPSAAPTSPAVPWWRRWLAGVRRFAATFRPDWQPRLEGALEVWVNRPQPYLEVLQQLVDASFTPQTGIAVNLSLMPDESRLVLAQAAGIAPDVALGVSTYLPFELAIRNALYDLRRFEDFPQVIRAFAPGALLGYIVDDGVYALPETQDFWVTFYRRDILEALGLPVPQTWDEVIAILPELQRQGMNYHAPLSGGPGLKGYLLTAPYLFNHRAPLYGEGGLTSGLSSEAALAAIRFMAESFTLYGMPVATGSFYEGFRQGTLPVGVSNMETYLRLRVAAPELEGLWGLALYPATVGEDGQLYRYATGSAQASIIFASTKQPDAAWTFLRWWLAADTQVAFQERLLASLGGAYLWNSANLEAFSRLPIPEAHREVILAQWQWLKEPVRLPGFYLQERELSNVWNRIVFDGANPRVAIDRAVTAINRELARRLEEFGYLRDGVPVREVQIPTIERIQGWIDEAR